MELSYKQLSTHMNQFTQQSNVKYIDSPHYQYYYKVKDSSLTKTITLTERSLS